MIIISTSGFSYKDWRGRFYPESIKDADLLSFFARFFDAVELNYSYYSIPGQKSIAGHLRKAPGMRFAIKGHQSFTHARKYGDRELDAFRAAMDQLRDEDGLIALLLQFPYSFHATGENLKYLEKLLKEFEDYPVAVEFRHSRWKNREAFSFLDERNVALVTTDAPALANLFRGGWERIGPFSYVRFHGRNAEKWWDHKEGWERYNYSYTQLEIEGMADAVKKLAEGGDDNGSNKKSPHDIYIFFNNHWQAQGAVNAMQLAARLGKQLPLEGLPDEIKKLLGSE